MKHRLCPRAFHLDFESYDKPTRYSDVAEALAETAEVRQKLRIVDEEMTGGRDRRGIQFGNGMIEYMFQNESFRHEHTFSGDWLSRKTILEMASRFSSLDDGFRFYGAADSQGLSLYYMLKSAEDRIRQSLDFSTLDELLANELSGKNEL